MITSHSFESAEKLIEYIFGCISDAYGLQDVIVSNCLNKNTCSRRVRTDDLIDYLTEIIYDFQALEGILLNKNDEYTFNSSDESVDRIYECNENKNENFIFCIDSLSLIEIDIKNNFLLFVITKSSVSRRNDSASYLKSKIKSFEVEDCGIPCISIFYDSNCRSK